MHSNPFSTRFVRPGAIPYLFSDGLSCAHLAERFEQCGSAAAILGPHGTGKSTLLATLLPDLQARGWQPHLIALHDGQRWLPRGWRALAENAWAAGTRRLLVIDGYEQLNRISRAFVKWTCRQHGWGLLVTAHAPAGLPVLFETHSSPAVTRALWARLAPHDTVLSEADCDEAWTESTGNVREALFNLYDRYERRRGGQNR